MAGMGKKNTLVKYAKHWDELSFSSHIMMEALAKHLLGLACATVMRGICG